VESAAFREIESGIMGKSKQNRSNHREVEFLEALGHLGGSARNAHLAEYLEVSEETVRRTSKSLAKAELVWRVRGGVYLRNAEADEGGFARSGKRTDGKDRIASAAAEMIGDGACLFLDGGATTAFVAQSLIKRTKLTVVTNSLNVAQILTGRNDNRVFLAGGELGQDRWGTSGPETLAFIQQFSLDFAVVSADAVDENSGFLLDDTGQAAIGRLALKSARRSIVLADRKKFGQAAPFVVCAPEQVSVVVTDQKPSQEFQGSFASWGVELVSVGKQDAK
jgi:DeoR family transcriptional regulator, glycerol-3-phosphate regulon repressor